MPFPEIPDKLQIGSVDDSASPVRPGHFRRTDIPPEAESLPEVLGDRTAPVWFGNWKLRGEEADHDRLHIRYVPPADSKLRAGPSGLSSLLVTGGSIGWVTMLQDSETQTVFPRFNHTQTDAMRL